MTACVAIAPDSRMDSSSSSSSRVDNSRARMSDDLDTSFGPAVGLLKEVDVISAYMTVAAEMAAERDERACAANSSHHPDSAAKVERCNDAYGAQAGHSTREISDEASSSPFASIPSQDSAKRDDQAEDACAAREDSKELSLGMELSAAVHVDIGPARVEEAASDSPSVQKEEEDKEVAVSSDVAALEFKQPAIEVRTNDGDLSKEATAEVPAVVYPVEEVAELAVAEKIGERSNSNFATNAQAEKFEVAEAAVTSKGNIDQDDGVAVNLDLRVHAYSDSAATITPTSTASTTNSVTALLTEPTEELTVPESSTTSAQPAETEDARTGKDENLTESLANLAKAHPFQFTGLNHVAFCCESLERSLDFYCGLLGLKTNLSRPDLPYRGAWLLLGAEGIHIMEVPNPDPIKDRPPHGGYDRHACLNVKNVDQLRMTFDKAGINYQLSMVPSIFCRDPDGNGLEFIEVQDVHVD